MADWSIEKKGDWARVTMQFSKLQDTSFLKEAMTEALTVVKQEASRFPPQPSRTRAPSGSFNTWVREVGQLPRSAFGVSRKTGKVTIRRSGKRIYRVSEKLIQKWKTATPQIRIGAGYIVGRVTNAASYGKWVQGEQQSKWHKATGWKTTSQIAQSQAGRIMAIFAAMLKKKFG